MFVFRVRASLVTLTLVAALGGVAAAADIALPTPVGMNGDPAAQMVLDGNAAFLHGDLSGATKYYRAALGRKSDFAIATFNLGLVEMHTGSEAQGYRDMDRGIALAVRNGMSERDIARLRTLRSSFSTQTKHT